jgi:hypothetical protein
MKKAVSPIMNPAADISSADCKGTDGAICKKVQVDTKPVTPNRTQDWLFIQSPGRWMV